MNDEKYGLRERRPIIEIGNDTFYEGEWLLGT
jgi:hypothetical protein